jgi:transcriptional regulator with XRE-family HTH domain
MTERNTEAGAASERVAKKIRFLMRTESMTLDQMAGRVGVPPEHIRYVMDGVSPPTRHLLEKFCAAFHVHLDFFGKDIERQLAQPPSAAPTASGKPTPPLPFTPATQKRKAIPIGVLPAEKTTGQGGDAKPKRKFDLAELAIHHQALLETLIEKKIISREAYQERVDSVRKRAGLA